MPPMLGQPLPQSREFPRPIGDRGPTSGANQAILQAEHGAGHEVGTVQGVSPDDARVVSVHLCTRVHPRLRISRVHRFPFALLHLSSVHLCTWYLV
jgi:hypothetical protein